MENPMYLVELFIGDLDNCIAIEFKDNTWMRIAKQNERYTWYNSNNPHQTFYFNKPNECFKLFELSVKPQNITEIVLNNPVSGNVLVYKKKDELDEIAEALLTMK